MGIRLIVEALDGAPATLTHRERYVLVVLCEDAPDDAREIWHSVEDPEILRRAHVSRSQMHEVLRSLVKKGAIERVGRGQKYRAAKYRIAKFSVPESGTLNGSQRPGFRDPEPDLRVPDSGTLNAQRPENPDAEDALSVPDSGTLNALSVPESGTPTPTYVGRQASHRGPLVPAWAQPLIDQLAMRGIAVSWARMTDLRWAHLQQLLRSHGEPYLIHLAGSRWNPDKPIKFGTLLLDIWQDYTPPPAGSPWHPDTVAARSRPRDVRSLPPYCGDIECDEISRTREAEDASGLPVSITCPKCHPSRKDTAA